MKVSTEAPRVRIAPSPTGKLHIGTARTALFNWLFARQYGGVFALRIEDTDLDRSRLEHEQDIIENLRWLGIEWDEGPDIGGEFGPYRQSERQKYYAGYLEGLLDKEAAYYCFCSVDELAAEREAMMMRGEAPRYDGKCRAIPAQEARERVRSGIPAVIRLKMPFKKVVIRDLIRGAVSFDTSLIGDIVIAKNLQAPLYNFAVVTDDADMKITHVLRGEDHLSNTPKQWMIAEAIGVPHPAYGHFPLILGPDRSKLSKRHGAMSIVEYRKAGYLSDALVNFIALLGWHPEGNEEILSREELLKQFSLARIQKGGAIFNTVKLDWLNGTYIRKKSPQDLLNLFMPYWERAGYVVREAGEGYLEKIALIERERIKKLSDIVEITDYFFGQPRPDPDLLVWKGFGREEARDSLAKATEALRGIPDDIFRKEVLEETLRPLYGDEKGKILWPIRVALSGKRASPGPFEIAEILGKEETIRRLEYARGIL